MRPYFGGTGATLEKIKEIHPTINIDGTTCLIENWFKEIELFEILIPNQSRVWIPYGGAEKYGIFKRIVWGNKFFKDYSFGTDETKDWWIAEPHLIVSDGISDWNVCEYSFYEQNLIPENAKLFSHEKIFASETKFNVTDKIGDYIFDSIYISDNNITYGKILELNSNNQSEFAGIFEYKMGDTHIAVSNYIMHHEVTIRIALEHIQLIK